MARDDACFGVPDLRRREQRLLTVNALDGVYHPRALSPAWMPSWPGASDRPWLGEAGAGADRAVAMMPPLVRHDPPGRRGSQRADRQPAAHLRDSRGRGLRRPPFAVAARCASRSHLTIRR